MVKKGTMQRLREIALVIAKIKAAIAEDDGTSLDFTAELQNLEKKYLDYLYQAMDQPPRRGSARKEVTDGH